ncbi:MAG: hypothetical protein EOM46_07060 [Gammaproteobacteria bacterium]|nr:hypothetical protein [Gammaproteobacteria bacterium]
MNACPFYRVNINCFATPQVEVRFYTGDYMNNNSFDSVKEIINKYIQDDKPLTFLLIGRTGVGKSSTVNSLLGEQIAPVGDYEPTTFSVKEYTYDKNGINILIYDTPGLCDDLPESGNDDNYLNQIKRKLDGVDVVFFVTELDSSRISGDEKRGIKKITEVLGDSIWKHSVIIFTKSDRIPQESLKNTLLKRTELLTQEISKYTRQFQTTIPSIGISNQNPSDRWLGELFTITFERMKNKGAFKFLVALNTDIGSETESSRITISPEQKERISTSGANRMNSALAGATAGAAIGSMIPVVGTVIGAGLGAIVGFFWS